MTETHENGVSRRQWLAASVAASVGVTSACAAQPTTTNEHAPIEALAAPANGPVQVAFLLDRNATLIDFIGPWEAFQDTGVGDRQGFFLYTVAPSTEEFQSTGNFVDGQRSGFRFRADYDFTNAPQPNVIVIGAQGRSNMPAKLDWVRAMAPGADIILSVCTGAFVLGHTGLIDGLSTTTHHDFYDALEQQFQGRINVVRGRRFVDNGKFVSAGGLTSGIDAALHVAARYYGVEAARASAEYMEHYSDGWLTGVRA